MESKFKILMFPWLAHGHINPFIELAKRLPPRNFIIYLCSTRVNLDSIRTTSNASSIQLIELHVPSSPELPPEMHTTKYLPAHHILTLLKAFQMSSSSFSEVLNRVKPDLLIYDMFQPWAPKLAAKKNIPCVFFATSGAAPISYYHHIHTVGPNSPYPHRDLYLHDREKGGMSAGIIHHIKDADKDAFSFGNFKMSTDIVLVKSSREVEDKYIDYLSHLSKKRVVPTGPLVVHPNDDHPEETWEIMKWLSEKSRCSTVYVSFGSECFLSKEEITEIATALLHLSEVNFLWIIRFPNGENPASIDEALPVGFLETVKGRGRVIEKWAPQAKILAHPSVGGFVSHCGWSSIIESMYFGVPIIAMPLKFDQPINARFAVGAGVGVEVEKDENGNYMRDEVEKAINKVIMVSGLMKDRVRRLSQKMKENEENEVDEIAELLLRICMK